MSSRARLIAVLSALGVIVIGVPVAVISTIMVDAARGIVTVETTPDGSERTVYWREYPGVAELDPEKVLKAPSPREGLRQGERMIAEIRAALTAEFGLEWAPPPAAEGTDWAYPAENGYGGPSMLVTVNGPSSQSTTVPTAWADKQRALEIIGDVIAGYGFEVPRFDQEVHPVPEDEAIRDLGGATLETQAILPGMAEGPSGQWLMFSFQDLSKDTDGRIRERLETPTDAGWQSDTITLMYGANGLLPEKDREEFLERLAPFDGLTRPEPQIS